MKQTHYFTVNFTGFTTAASEEQSYLRLIAGEHAFYTDKRHFKDPSLFDRLRLGQPLHIGTRRLKDGSYWIHWLSNGEMLIEPCQKVLSLLLIFALILLPLLYVGAIAIYTMNISVHLLSLYAVIAMFSFFALVGVTLIMVDNGKLKFPPPLKLNPRMRDLLTKIERARGGDFSFCQILQDIPQISPNAHLAFAKEISLPERYLIREGQIKDATFREWSTGSGRTLLQYQGVNLLCDKTQLTFSWRTSCCNFGLHPLFYRRHPPFLVNGDRIVTVCERKSDAIQALYNISDNSIFLKNHWLYPGNRQMSLLYTLFYCTLLMVFLILFGMSQHDMQEAVWDSRKLAADALDALFNLLSFGELLAMFELLRLIPRFLSAHVADWLALRSSLAHYQEENRSPISLQEIM